MCSASCSGSVRGSARTTGSGTKVSGMGSSRRAVRERSRSRQIRPVTVVSQPPRLSTPSAPARSSRSQVSWTASSASAREPSIRYATARNCPRCSSNRSASRAAASAGGGSGGLVIGSVMPAD
ncbi:hypothetical protein SFUMM280S_10154 [Streptomyces fumanus]